ncbi:unnamed protein product [Caenorhabditis auriculariae]|uniref:Uncharacterized protein n=1 Tax=Caenorhabditis auriculariae TaxID=2777116 RepID=A0A8S1HRJ7_9PELO|nr:unnamed protein product [Caenorhabditis auriculariae]
MKRLKRRLSAAFRGNNNSNNNNISVFESECDSGRGSVLMSYGMYTTAGIIGNGVGGRTWSLSDSMSHLADRLAADGVIVEECDPSAMLRVSRGGTAGRRGCDVVGGRPPPPRTHSMYNPRVYHHPHLPHNNRNSYYGSHASMAGASGTSFSARVSINLCYWPPSQTPHPATTCTHCAGRSRNRTASHGRPHVSKSFLANGQLFFSI